MSERAANHLTAQMPGLLTCVHCGFCLSACPTYDRLGHEGDSPRGRLDLMRAVAEGRLAADDPSFHQHIDQCLGCRACEPVCPSGVPYGFLLEHARATMAEATGVSLSTRLLIAAFTGRFRSVVGVLSRVFRATRLPHLLARLPVLPQGLRFACAMLASSAPIHLPRLRAGRTDRQADEPGERPRERGGTGAKRATQPGEPGERPRERGNGRVERATHPGEPAGPVDDSVQAPRQLADPHALQGGLPVATSASAAASQAVIGPQPEVALVDGCVQQALFGRVNSATAAVLEAWGATCRDAPGQACCGALDAHAGRLERARALARQNIKAFERAGADFVIVNAAGCGAMMKEYPHHLAEDPAWAERAARFSARVRDLNEFLLTMPAPPMRSIRMRIACDEPCHLLHAQRIEGTPQRLLDGVPGLERVPLRGTEECCGGAGLYGVHHPDLGGRVLGDKLDAIEESGADVVTTPNPGCMMQIGAGLLLRGSQARVMHPVEILAHACAVHEQDAEGKVKSE